MKVLGLSLFPGIGLLDQAFEEVGFTIVRGPDSLWGGDIRGFHVGQGKFDFVIGGPPCQAHSRYACLNRKIGNRVAEDLIPEFERVVLEAMPDCFVMENVPDVPDLEIEGYKTDRVILDNRWLGEKQSRRRVFQFGSRYGRKLQVMDFSLEHPEREPTCLASEGGSGRITYRDGRSFYNPRRSFKEVCRLQGLPENFLNDAPFTSAEKYRVVGNGVPLPMGRAIARAVAYAMGWLTESEVAA
jgi:DNA (cytosine-5)-methyltransferase 1